MNALVIGLYGLFIILVGFNGHSKELMAEGSADAPGFLPWAISIAVLAVMYENQYTQKVAQPFIVLLIVTFIVKNFDKLQSQFKQLYAMASQSTVA
jgi:hypothetical protein